MDDGDFLERRGQEEVQPLPTEKERRRDHRVLHQQAQRQKDRSVSGDCEHRDTQIGERLRSSWSVQQVRAPAHGHLRQEAERELQEDREAEKRAPRDHAGDVFPDHQDIAAQRCQEVEVQAALENLPADEIGEESKTSEEDDQAQKKHLEKDAVGLSDIGDRLDRYRLHPGREHAEREQKDRQKSDQNDRQRPRTQEGLAQLEPEHGANLTRPVGNSPRSRFAHRFCSHQLAVPEGAPIRYWYTACTSSSAGTTASISTRPSPASRLRRR